MDDVLDLGDLSVDVIRKDIKNLHLSVHPPTGRVRIAAPQQVSAETIRAFAISHLAWIKRNQRKLAMQEREPAREYLDRESHFVWGERLLLQVIELEAKPTVTRGHKTLSLRVRPNTPIEERRRVLEKWYRLELRRVSQPIRSKWEAHLGVNARNVLIQRMKTKWGSCNPASGNIRLNTELAKKPVECLEYVLLHELAHLREPRHSPRFHDLLDQAMPQWRSVRQLLNELPLGSSGI
jgi:predicted metal-dependent hydrolase